MQPAVWWVSPIELQLHCFRCHAHKKVGGCKHPPKDGPGRGRIHGPGDFVPMKRERSYLRYLAFAAFTHESLAAPDMASHFSIATL